MRRILSFAAVCALLGFAASSASAIVINEFVANHTGTDDMEFIEVVDSTRPNTDLSNFWVVEVEGDSGQTGLIDDATMQVGMTDGNGIWVSPFMNNVLENGTLTLLLVAGFTGAVGDDIDTNDDGVIDNPLWSAVLDDVAVNDGGAGDLAYSAIQLTPGFDGNAFTPGGASRIPHETDTDSVADWLRNNFDKAGYPGFPTTVNPGEALNTPGDINAIPEPASLMLLTLGGLALLRRRP